MPETELSPDDFPNFKFFQAAIYLQQIQRIIDSKEYENFNYYLRVWRTFLANAYYELIEGEPTNFTDPQAETMCFYQHHSEKMAIELLGLTDLNGEQWYEGLDNESCVEYVRIKLEKANGLMFELMGRILEK